MNDEEKVFYKFMENKILLKKFCEEYIKIKKNEEYINKEANEIKLKNCQLENEIEKYKDILKNIEKKKVEEIENNNFEFDIKIKKLEKHMNFLNSCLNTEKENYHLNAKELISLKYENNKLKSDLNKSEYNTEDKENQINQNNITVLNKIYSDIDKKIEDMTNLLNEIKNCRNDAEQKIKDYETLLSNYLKKISDINLKYEQFYKLYKEAEHKNNMSKYKKKVLKNRISELKNCNKLLSNQISTLKKDIKIIEMEKNEYYSLLKKAEKKNLLLYHKLKKNDDKFYSSSDYIDKNDFLWDMLNENIEEVFYNNLKNKSSLIKGDLILSQNVYDYINLKEIEKRPIYLRSKTKRRDPYRLEEFNIKRERKRKNILFYSDNDYDKKKRRKDIK
ncbi:conserved Plasmodium protein, unknown function [Plasmodium gallinaceum]|uniref:Uncharacterized protein n=1 Tax=Plasmodium gallinaceum TaxID=5849 RepID=A0A1J1GNJ4_PLAGA|nr:conserved Plasmodium protein, unknown function [Plasmodium gallinaceum]CRG94049.1 conserved Plasmodium protein, unknown function [Plasmodium gallinaceum]